MTKKGMNTLSTGRKMMPICILLTQLLNTIWPWTSWDGPYFIRWQQYGKLHVLV